MKVTFYITNQLNHLSIYLKTIFPYFEFNLIINMQWIINDFGLEYIIPNKRDISYLSQLLKEKTNTTNSCIFDRRINDESSFIQNPIGLICHVPVSILNVIDYPFSIGCFEIKQNGERELPVYHLYLLGIIEEKPKIICQVPFGFNINGIFVKEQSYLFILDDKKKKKKKIEIFRTEPLIWVYIYHFDTPCQNDIDFLSYFDIVEQSKARLVTLGKITTGEWGKDIQILNHPLKSRADWLRDRFTIHFLILSLAKEEYRKHIQWFIYAESIMVRNNLSLITLIDDKLLTMKNNGEENRPFDINYLVNMHQERIKNSIEAVQLELLDSKIIETFEKIWRDKNELSIQMEKFNQVDSGWKKVSHIKKVVPKFIKMPVELTEIDKKFFDMNYGFGLTT